MLKLFANSYETINDIDIESPKESQCMRNIVGD